MVTKRQQLAWLVSKIVKWPADGAKIPVSIDDAGNPKFYMPWDAFAPLDVMRVDFTCEEWQQERDKMQKKAEQVAQPEVDNSWHERGELPPVGVVIEAWFDDGRECWHKADVVGYNKHENGVIAASLIGKHERKLVWVHHFRPIRTEREKAIEEMVKLIGHGYMSAEMAKELAIKMYDSGYHR